jgi:hypothetical protein
MDAKGYAGDLCLDIKKIGECCCFQSDLWLANLQRSDRFYPKSPINCSIYLFYTGSNKNVNSFKIFIGILTKCNHREPFAR